MLSVDIKDTVQLILTIIFVFHKLFGFNKVINSINYPTTLDSKLPQGALLLMISNLVFRNMDYRINEFQKNKC